jgi:hypothetical protein
MRHMSTRLTVAGARKTVPLVDVVDGVIQERLMLCIHIVDALPATNRARIVSPRANKQHPRSRQVLQAVRRCIITFRPPTIFEALANRSLLPNKSPVRLLSHAMVSMPFTSA